MEGASEPEPMPRRRRRVVLVLAVGVVVVAAGFVVYWEFIRPRTIAEVFAFEHFQPGTSVAVQGTITRIYRENTTYGTQVSLQLDHYAGCDATGLTSGLETGEVLGDPNATYSIGQAFQTTLHFQSYTINGDPAVWAPELACPFPSGFASLRSTMDVVSRFMGILLVYNGSESGGWQDYRVYAHNGEAYNPSAVGLTLERCDRIVGDTTRFPPGSSLDSAASWDVLRAILTYEIAGGGPSAFSPLADEMTSLRNGTSLNGTLRFVDTNADRMLDNGDILGIRLPPTTSATAWKTYLLQIGTSSGLNSSYVGGEHIIIDGPQGPLEALLSSELPMVDLAYAGTQTGPPLQTTVQVASVRIGPPLPLGAIRYSLSGQTAGGGYFELSGNVSSLPSTTANGVTLSLSDSNSDGLLDAGDRLTVIGAANQTSLDLFLIGPEGGGGMIQWIAGFGPTLGSVRAPTFTLQGSGPWTIRVGVPSWSPELAFNRTLRATLLENGQAVVTNVSLANGTLGTFANGCLNFTDADGDGYLSTGDYFSLSGKATNQYQIVVTAFFGVDQFSSPVIP